MALGVFFPVYNPINIVEIRILVNSTASVLPIYRQEWAQAAWSNCLEYFSLVQVQAESGIII